MGNRHSKRNRKTEESPRRDKRTKRIKGVKYDQPEAIQRSIDRARSRGHDDLLASWVVISEPKKDSAITDTSKPQPAATAQTSYLSLEPNEAASAINVAKGDADKTRGGEGTRKDVADLVSEPIPVTSTHGTLSANLISTDVVKSDEKKTRRTRKVLEPESIGLETVRLPAAKSVDVASQSEVTATPPPIGTVMDSNCEEQDVRVVDEEEKKLLTVSDTQSTVVPGPESSGATAEVAGEGRGQEAQYKTAAQETQLKHGSRAQEGSDHVSSIKKPAAQRKRRKRTGRHALTVDNVLRELKDVSWQTLSNQKELSYGAITISLGVLQLHKSQRRKIEAEYSTEDERKTAAVLYWLASDPYASWRRLIRQLHIYEEHAVAKQILRYAEKLTDPTLTLENISTVTATMPLEHDELGKVVLSVPESEHEEIRRQSSTAAEERERLIRYYLNYSPYASWGDLAGRLYRRQHHDALSAARRFIKTEPDPTLTLPNLTPLLERMSWNSDTVGWRMGIPKATMDTIRSSGGDDSQRRRRCWEVYFSDHPAPSWKRVAEALYTQECLEELEVVQKKYLRGTAENKRQFEEAMKEGKVKAWLCKLLMYGHAGSGKTTTMEIIVGNKPLEHRESTPLATRPTTIYRVNLDSEEWAKLSTLTDRKLLVARALIRDAPQLVDRLLAARSNRDPMFTDPTPLKVEPQAKSKHPVLSVSREPPVPGNPSLDSIEAGFLEDPLESDASDEDNIEAEADAILESISTDEELVKLMDQLSTTIDPLTAFRILEMIDCGGQPQFHEILPVFLRHLDFYVFVFRLCDELDSRPLVEFYVDGKPVGKPIPSSQTVEQLLQHCARSMHTYRSTSDSENESPKIMVIGTHADLENKSKESREQKNERILKLLLPNLEEQIIYCDNEQVFFPLNALNPGPEEDRNIEKIRNILLGSSSRAPVDIPLRWFAFEILLKEMTGRLHRGVVSREECFTTAMDKLHFEDDAAEFDAAIDYLHNLSVLFYYQDILPEVVFADPQVIYDKVSELVLAHYRITTNPQARALTDDWRKFYKFALVTDDFLSQSEFSKHYVPGLFEREHLIKLFKKLLIFATFGDAQLFVPALLRELSKKEVDKYCMPSDSALSIHSFALEFPDGGPRKGLFCSLLSWLVSPDNDCIGPLCISTDSTRAPICLYRNCIQLKIPKSPAIVTLVDAYTHFEVHVQVPMEHAEKVCPKLVPLIRKAIFRGLHRAALNLHYSNSTPSAALVCPCGNRDAHIATVNMDLGFWTCSLDSMKCGELSSLQLLWIDNHPICHPWASPCDTQPLQEIPHLVMLLNQLKDRAWQWRDIGSNLGFSQGELNNIQASIQQQDVPVGYLRAMLTQWFQWAPQDNRGSSSFATLNALKTALKDCGLAATASNISLH